MAGKPKVALDSAVGAALRLEVVRAGYSDKTVLGGISVDVPRGRLTALIGMNGAGKSTVLKVAMGLVRPTSGTVYFDGRDVTRDATAMRARCGMGYLSQRRAVFPSLTVRENLLMGLRITPTGDRDARFERVAEFLPFVVRRLNHRAGLLSGGERRCLALAMVLCQSPKVMLLDEPSAGMSPMLAATVLDRIREMSTEAGMTTVLVEQRAHEAIAIADRAIALVNGVVAATTDTPDEWMEAGRMEELFFTRTWNGRA